MMERIFIHFGSDKEFKKKISNIQDSVYLSEIVDILTRREIEIANVPRQPQNPLFVENLIIHTDDYGGINEWATLGFSHSILENKRLNIKNVWINNPTRKIYQDLNKVYGEKIEQIMEPLKSIDLEVLKSISMNFSNNIIGQPNVCRKLLTALYSLTKPNRERPVSLLFLGDSGVGKTETAKLINTYMDGKMVRVQCSMYQTAEAFKYIFGGEHGEDSLARELIRRESNVILLDEFDKVYPLFYNAFYQMLDEGKFVDKNYEVDVSDCIIICTSNFKTEKEAKKVLGMPIYSRFSKMILFDQISIGDKLKIASINYSKLFSNLSKEDQALIKDNRVLEKFNHHIKNGVYRNMRILKNDIEEALNYEILKKRGIIK